MKKIAIFILFLTIPLLLIAGDYTFIETHNVSTDLISGTQTAGTWLDISDLTVNAYNGFTPTSGTTTSVTSTNGGTYFVKYSVSFDATASCDWTIAVDVNGTNYHEITRRIGSSSDVGNASGSGLLVLSASDVLKLEVSPSIGATKFTPVDVQLVLVEVKESTTAPEYASMSINSMVDDFNVGTGYTTFTQLGQRDVSTNWSAASGVLTCNSADAAGTYLAIFSFSGEAASLVLTDIGISLNNGDPTTILTQRVFGKSNDIGNVSGGGIVTIANGNTIRLKGKGASAKNFDIYFANVTLVKIVDEQDAPYASMNIESLTSAFTVNATWTKVVNGLADDVTNGTFWSFSDNSIKPVGVSGGYYLVNYYYSITGGSGAEATIVVDGDIGVNSNTEQLDLAIKRKLDKKDGVDIGAAAGTGIIFIDEAEDDITMLLRAPGGANDLRLRKANLSIFRVEKVGDATLPVELSTFTGQYINNTPTLYWVTHSETDNIGWNVYRNSINDFTSSDRVNNSLIPGHGTTTQVQNYLYEDLSGNFQAGDDYWYWLESIDFGGAINHYDKVALIHIAEHSNPDPHVTVPKKYGLQSLPNPFNSNLSISYMLHQTDMVRFEIYNMNGQLIARFNEGLKTGDKEHVLEWDGRDLYGNEITTGVFLIKLITSEDSETTKAILLR